MKTQLQKLAKAINVKVGMMNGESCTFEVIHNEYLAIVRYEAEIGEDMGDYWTAPSSWIKSERVEVVELSDDNGDDMSEEAYKYINQLLN